MLKEKGYSDKTFREGKAPKQIATGLPLRVVITGEKKNHSVKHCETCGEQKGQTSTLLFHTHTFHSSVW